jgi:hypothetical protein
MVGWWETCVVWAQKLQVDILLAAQQFYLEVSQDPERQLFYFTVVGWIVTIAVAITAFIRVRSRLKSIISNLQNERQDLELELKRERIWRKAAGDNKGKVTEDDLAELQRLIKTT